MISNADGVDVSSRREFLAGFILTATVLLSACQARETTSETSAVQDRATEVRADDKTMLAVPHIQQETLLCVPTSAAMILAYYGDPQPLRRLKVLASGGVYDPATSFSDYSITLYRDLVRGVQSLGYSWAEQDYPDTEAGFTDGLALVESQVRNGEPVMVDVSAPQGHTLVISGFDRTGRRLLAVDPNLPAPGQRWIAYDAFKAIWNEHAFNGDFRALVRTQPRATS